MTTFSVIIICLLLGWVTSYYAQKRGRDPFIWFIAGYFFGLLALLLLFILPAVPISPQKNESSDDTLKIAYVPENFAGDWFYVDNEKAQQGPVTFERLQELWQEKVIQHQTYVWRENMPNWQFIKDIPGLQEVLMKDAAN